MKYRSKGIYHVNGFHASHAYTANAKLLYIHPLDVDLTVDVLWSPVLGSHCFSHLHMSHIGSSLVLLLFSIISD